MVRLHIATNEISLAWLRKVLRKCLVCRRDPPELYKQDLLRYMQPLKELAGQSLMWLVICTRVIISTWFAKARGRKVNVSAVGLHPASHSRDLRAVWVTLATGRSREATSGSVQRGIKGRHCVTFPQRATSCHWGEKPANILASTISCCTRQRSERPLFISWEITL